MHIDMTSATPGLPPIATTADIAAGDKLDFWHEAVSRSLMDLEYQPSIDGPFEATLSGIRLNALSLSRIQASGHSASRTVASIARRPCDAVVFDFVVSGAVIAEQDGRVARLAAGDGVFCDTARPYYFRSDQAFDIASLHVPRKALFQGVTRFDGLTAVNLAQVGRLWPLVFGYLSHLMAHAPMLGSMANEQVSQNFVDLLKTMIGDIMQPERVALSDYRHTVLLRVKDFIERNLGDVTLGPATVAAALRLKPRYINRLLEAEETSLSRYIWQRRLERCASELRDSRRAGSSITSIALENGFTDLSHFSKAFRQRFDVSARTYRQQARLGA